MKLLTTSLLLASLTLAAAPAYATDLTPDCKSVPTFGAAVGSASSTTTFITAIIPHDTTSVAVYTYAPSTLTHGGPYLWSIDPTARVGLSGNGWGSAASTTPITALAFAPSTTFASATDMSIGSAVAFTFRGITVPGPYAFSWAGGGLTAVDSLGAQTMSFAGYSSTGGSSSHTVQTYGVCSGVAAYFSSYQPPYSPQAMCTYSVSVGIATATTYSFVVDGLPYGAATASPTVTMPCDDFYHGPHTLAAVATDDVLHSIVSPVIPITIPWDGCVRWNGHCI